MGELSDGGAGGSVGQVGQVGRDGRGGREYPLVPLHHLSDGPPPRGGEDEIVPLRQRADGWTPEKQRAFLEHLSSCGSVAAAARSVGLSREGAYALRRRVEGRGFAQAWDAARLLAQENLVEVAWDRAMNGVTRAIYYHGERVGEVVHHDSRLLLGLIAQNRALAERLLAEPERAGSPFASGAVVGAVLADWDAALARVERGEALAEPAPEPVAEPVIEPAAADAEAGADPLPPPLPPAFENDGSRLDEAQVLNVGCYAHWWDARLDCWLTNWPAPADWAGTRYGDDPLGAAGAELVQGDDGDAADRDLDIESETVRTLTPAEEAGLARLETTEEDARAARLELYRRAAFGLATPAEQAALAAVNSVWPRRGAVADPARAEWVDEDGDEAADWDDRETL